MTYRIPLPEGSRRPYLDIIEPQTTAVQRYIRRHGLGTYETSTAAAVLACCELHDPDFVMFDVGANMGLYGALAASVFSPAAVHSFEPTPHAAAVVRKIARRNRLPLTCHEMALSDSSGTAELFLSPTADASNSLASGFRETSESIRVEVDTLDSVVERLDATPGLVKLDVETHERAVLDGGRRTFERHRPALVVEVLRRKGRDHGEEITAFFQGLGYTFYELSADPSWHAQTAMTGSGTQDRDWLALPDRLPVAMIERWALWRDRLLVCDQSRNPRVPVMRSIIAAHRRGGVSEVLATGRRYLRSKDRNA